VPVNRGDLLKPQTPFLAVFADGSLTLSNFINRDSNFSRHPKIETLTDYHQASNETRQMSANTSTPSKQDVPSYAAAASDASFDTVMSAESSSYSEINWATISFLIHWSLALKAAVLLVSCSSTGSRLFLAIAMFATVTLVQYFSKKHHFSCCTYRYNVASYDCHVRTMHTIFHAVPLLVHRTYIVRS
jgi:uncharacterized membrane protein